jgi:hypothetical protein
MAYRNGTYIAFHADGMTDPTASDIRYYRMLKAWHENDDISFRFVNSHDKASSVRDTSKKETLRASLRERLNNSKNMVLIIGKTTRFDTDWVPFEIAYAADRCGIPIFATYTGYKSILNPALLADLWPPALATRIRAKTVNVLHIPFKRTVIDAAVRQFNINTQPVGPLDYYTKDSQIMLGVDI